MSIPKDFGDSRTNFGTRNRRSCLAELNYLLTGAPRDQIELLPAPSIDDPYLVNYVATMVEQANFLKGGILPPGWTDRKDGDEA